MEVSVDVPVHESPNGEIRRHRHHTGCHKALDRFSFESLPGEQLIVRGAGGPVEEETQHAEPYAIQWPAVEEIEDTQEQQKESKTRSDVGGQVCRPSKIALPAP